MNTTSAPVPAQDSTVPATDKQITYLRTLLAERGIEVPEEAILRLSKKGASASIAKALTLPKAASATSSGGGIHPGLTTGFYLYEGDVYKVRPSQKTGRLYPSAMYTENGKARFTSFGVRKYIYKLTPEHKLTAEQAKEYGPSTSHCVCCGKWLTDDLSVERGVGPECFDKYFG